MSTTGYFGDAASWNRGASVDFDYDSIRFDDENPTDSPDALLEERIKEIADRRTAAALNKFIALILDSTDYRLKLDIAIAALGFTLFEGKSFTSLADKHKITKQAFSKRVRKFQDEFGLPSTTAQKSKAARESYRQAQLKLSARSNQAKNDNANTDEKKHTRHHPRPVNGSGIGRNGSGNGNS